MVKEESIGYCFSPDDKAGIINFLDNLTMDSLQQLKMMGERAPKVAESRYSENAILNKFLETL